MRPAGLRTTLLCAALAAPLSARATGAAMLTGPVAIPRDLVAPDEPSPRGLRLFALGGVARTGEDFSEIAIGLDAGVGQLGVMRRTSDNFFVMLSGGLHAGGAVDPDGAPSSDLGAGLLVQAAATWRVLEGYDGDPFVTATFGMSLLRGRSEVGGKLDVNDMSLGVAVGRAFDETWAPYLAAKTFAGPSSWRWEGERLHGHDSNRWSAAAGAIVALEGGFDLQVEVAPLGARSATLAVGFAW